MGHGNYFNEIGILIMELNNRSGRDQLIIIDIWMKSRCLKVHQLKKVSCISQIWYHSPISCSTENYENFTLSHSRLFKNDHRILYVIYVRLLAKLWDNEFSWNHDRTYLLQVMVGIFFVCGSGSQSGALCNMGYLLETYLKLKSFEVSFAHI